MTIKFEIKNVLKIRFRLMLVNLNFSGKSNLIVNRKNNIYLMIILK